MHSTKKANHQAEDYIRHKVYLRKIKTNSLFCPRYEYTSFYSVCSHFITIFYYIETMIQNRNYALGGNLEI